MTIQEIENIYGRSSQVKALLDLLGKKQVKMISLKGLVCSSAPIFFASVYQQLGQTVLFVLDDADEAGYFYHDLTQMMGQEYVFSFLPAIVVLSSMGKKMLPMKSFERKSWLVYRKIEIYL